MSVRLSFTAGVDLKYFGTTQPVIFEYRLAIARSCFYAVKWSARTFFLSAPILTFSGLFPLLLLAKSIFLVLAASLMATSLSYQH